jgi:perosamine synthetase
VIPVFEPSIGEEEIEAVVNALRRGEISGSYGEYIDEFERSFADYCGCTYGVAVTSGTTALHLAVAATGIKPGEEVLVSSSTNIATALAAFHNNAIPVPVDSETETWNLDLDLIEPLITAKTRIIIPVHLFGHPVDMDRVNEIADRRHLSVIEDCAEAHGATCRGRKTGSFGDMGCFSFYANKIITTGEGGMIVTNDKKTCERLKLLRNLAFTTPRFRHEYAGYNFRMTGYQAAMGTAQLKKIDRIIAEKRRIAQLYHTYLKNISGLQLPVEREWAFNVYWMYGILVNPDLGLSRDRLAEILSRNEIETRTFFCPMNQQPCLQSIRGFRNIPCPVADQLWDQGLYLPSSQTLTEEQIRYISECIAGAIADADAGPGKVS